MFNPDYAKRVRKDTLTFGDAYLPLVRIGAADRSEDPTSTNAYRRISIDANGSDDSKVILFLNIGASASDYTQYQFSAAASAVADPDGIDSSPTHTQCDDLAALVTALNAVSGVVASRLHGAADQSLDSDDFIDLTEQDIPSTMNPGDFLYRDASELLGFSGRVALLNHPIESGLIKIREIVAYANSDGAADAQLTIKSDLDEFDESYEQDFYGPEYIPDATRTQMVDWNDNPPVVRGPLLVEVAATTSLAAGAYVEIVYESAEL